MGIYRDTTIRKLCRNPMFRTRMAFCYRESEEWKFAIPQSVSRVITHNTEKEFEASEEDQDMYFLFVKAIIVAYIRGGKFTSLG